MKKDDMKAIPENEALALLKGMQGAKSVTVPVFLQRQKLHDGVTFSVSLADYNKFLNASQSGKVSLTVASKDLLMHTVDKEHKAFLTELLGVTGMLDFVMGEVIKEVAPHVSSTLD
ncbi:MULTISPECIES: putative phage tail assembly chaperone [Shewanella]|uniref:putative phage tail assembly chaperone n=1 Tax=Shewanella TaxID=22 RepID=UPI00131A4570|nr:putative phage tail assembly chaperone [Shewanella sp. WE21]